MTWDEVTAAELSNTVFLKKDFIRKSTKHNTKLQLFTKRMYSCIDSKLK